MRRQYIAVFVLSIMGGVLMAQNETDAFRYAQYSPTGTARYTSLAGSMGGFGADFTVLSANNPAGIGLYKRSEFTLTPMLQYTKINSSYNGKSMYGSKYDFVLDNLGFVLSVPLSSSSKWKSFQLATGYNNLARYDGYSIVKGPNNSDQTGTTNFFDYITDWTNARGISNSSIFISRDDPNYYRYPIQRHIASFAWYHWLIDAVPGTDNQYYSVVDDAFEQKQTTTTNGYLNEYIFSGGANYDDMLYIGATIGIPFFTYTQETSYTESANAYYDDLEYYNEFQARATGINFKLGLLYQPVDFLRFGAGFHTPTLYNNVKESYYEFFYVSNYDIDTTRNGPVVPDYEGSFNYQLITPYHVMGNVAFLFNRYGFINIDYEFVDYATSHMQSSDYDFADETDNIRKYYKGTHTVRLGGELNLSPIALRLGGSYTTNPYTKEVNKDGSIWMVSAGIGFKTRYFFMDFAYRYKFQKDKEVFYNASNINPYESTITTQSFALTLGCKIGK